MKTIDNMYKQLSYMGGYWSLNLRIHYIHVTQFVTYGLHILNVRIAIPSKCVLCMF